MSLDITTEFKQGAGMEPVHNFAEATVGVHPTASLVLIVAFAIVIIILFLKMYWGEGFNPTATMRQQETPLSGSEALENPGPDCDPDSSHVKRDGAWSWLVSTIGTEDSHAYDLPAKEGMAGAKKRSDSQLSAVAMGF